jgi:hypothetical protein
MAGTLASVTGDIRPTMRRTRAHCATQCAKTAIAPAVQIKGIHRSMPPPARGAARGAAPVAAMTPGCANGRLNLSIAKDQGSVAGVAALSQFGTRAPTARRQPRTR